MRNNVKSLLRENARKGIRPSTQRELAARITELTSIIIGETYISRIANGLVNPGGALVLAQADHHHLHQAAFNGTVVIGVRLDSADDADVVGGGVQDGAHGGNCRVERSVHTAGERNGPVPVRRPGGDRHRRRSRHREGLRPLLR